MWACRFRHSLKLERTFVRGYQTTTASASKLPLMVSAAALTAGGAGYWIAKQQQQEKESRAQTQRPQVPIPNIPTHATLNEVFVALRKVLPAQHVSIDEELLQQHGYSNNSYHNEGAPNIVVFPSNTQEVAEVVKVANQYGLPIIPFSGGTSLEGHFSAPRGGICISFTEHMDNIVSFHPDDLDIVVQPGIQWEDLNNYLKKAGLFFPMDPGPG
jgi:D-lactate dehydrogenase (cytochrome)